MPDPSRSGEKIYGLAFSEIQDAESVEQAVFLLRDRYELGHVTYHLAQTITGKIQIDNPFVRTTYPAEWIARYLTKGYVKVDPVILEGLRRSLPFDWSTIDVSDASAEMLQDSQAHGLGAQGYSIPITDKVGRRALLSLNSRVDEKNWSKLVKANKQDWADLAQTLHKKAVFEQFGESDPIPALSRRELETLHWAAEGKDHKEIAKIIGISDHTVRTYMRSARHKLDCVNMPHAVAKAIKLHLIRT
ncbi:LuxR family transcriptional regulator [uncultured Cohaesibacter sp.]|uniref:helix-turn-helix transcriptional regulator n=1 Tax=uncultured Cohaesibacter sp. TaxID=1002546 RepID=UPI00292E8612|nr:LuxR family transcriptional regulator [uncultured Cohaesibacter sp.]